MIVYTALFNEYDNLLPNLHKDVRHVVFTEKRVHVDGWETRIVNRQFNHPAKDNRYYKLQPHKHFPNQTTLYMDACTQLQTHPEAILRFYRNHAGKANLYAIEHPLRHTLPMEFEWVRNKQLVQPDILMSMQARYTHVPQDKVGIEARLLIHTGGEEHFFDTWWSEVREYAHRDQLSFHYARHHANPNMATLPMPTVRPHFKLQRHAKGRS